MARKPRVENISRSVLFGLLSAALYFGIVVFGVYFQWNDRMRNGEPGNLMNIVEAEKLTITALYRSHVFWWLIAIGVVAILMFLLFWNTGKAMEDKESIRKCAGYERVISVIILIAIYTSYIRHFWEISAVANTTVNIILIAIQGIASVCALFSLLYKGARSLRRNHVAKAQTPKTTQPKPAYSAKVLILVFIRFVADLLPIIDLLTNMSVVSGWVYRMFSKLYVPSPFMIRNVFDGFVIALPMLAGFLMLLNMRFNAPLIVGVTADYRPHFRKGFTTLVTFRN